MANALSIYNTAFFASTLANALKLATATGSITSGNQGGSIGKSTGWGEISTAGQVAFAGAGSVGSPSGKSWLLDVTTLEGQQISAGNWSGLLNIEIDVVSSGSVNVDTLQVNYYKYNAGVYTAIGSSTVTGPGITTGTTTSLSIPNTSLSAVNFVTGDKIYIDVWAHVAANTSSNHVNIYLVFSNTSALGSRTGICYVDTPGYITVNTSSYTDTVTSAETATYTEAITATDSVTSVESATSSITSSPVDSVTGVDSATMALSTTYTDIALSATDTGASTVGANITESVTSTEQATWAQSITLADVPLSPVDVPSTTISAAYTDTALVASDSLVWSSTTVWTLVDVTLSPVDSSTYASAITSTETQVPSDSLAATCGSSATDTVTTSETFTVSQTNTSTDNLTAMDTALYGAAISATDTTPLSDALQSSGNVTYTDSATTIEQSTSAQAYATTEGVTLSDILSWSTFTITLWALVDVALLPSDNSTMMTGSASTDSLSSIDSVMNAANVAMADSVTAQDAQQSTIAASRQDTLTLTETTASSVIYAPVDVLTVQDVIGCLIVTAYADTALSPHDMLALVDILTVFVAVVASVPDGVITVSICDGVIAALVE